MKHFRKAMYFTLVLVLVLSLSLMGCGSGKEAAKVNDGDVIEWSFYTPYGSEEGVCCDVWKELFAEVEKQTEGRLVITPYWYGQHPYQGEEMLKALNDGAAQLAHIYSGYVTSVEPVFGADAVPMLLPEDPMESWEITSRLWGGFNQDTKGVLESILQERWNATMVHCLPSSPQRIFTTGYRVDGVDSLEGHKIRVASPEQGQLVELLGGTPISIVWGEVYTSLSTNLIDGYVTSTMFANSGGLFDFTDTINAWEIMASTDGVIADLDALAALPEDVREIFLSIMNESATKPETIELEINDGIVADRVASGKVEFYKPDASTRAEVKALVEEKIWPAWLEITGEDGERVIAQINE